MSPDGVAIDSMPVDAIRRDLAAWYARHRRTLPWRADAGAAGDGASPVLHPDPYAVWISEVMLQQTQVATATPYFQRWMARFPRVADLAAADLDAVLGFWQGLGYYARARNLHRAARAIMTVHGGRLPDDVEALRRLPGIGAYTAGAIASIAFGLREPAVDGNARRVLARLGAIAGDPARGAAAAAIHALARRLADDPAPGDVNQALMELGATVCVPRTPRCGGCPVAGHCRAFATGRGPPSRWRRPDPGRASSTCWPSRCGARAGMPATGGSSHAARRAASSAACGSSRLSSPRRGPIPRPHARRRSASPRPRRPRARR